MSRSGGSLEKFGLSKGMQGYFGNPGSIPAMEIAKLIQLEWQRSMSSPILFC